MQHLLPIIQISHSNLSKAFLFPKTIIIKQSSFQIIFSTVRSRVLICELWIGRDNKLYEKIKTPVDLRGRKIY